MSFYHNFSLKFCVDPCEENNRIDLHVSGDRSTACKQKSSMVCDSNMGKWVRPIRDGKDVQMPNACVDTYSCGTQYPIWLNGRCIPV